jgi:hypothetical protein
MQLRADALRFVLAQGLPAVIEVSGGSMEPTIRKGAKVDVVALGDAAPLAVGDVVLLATTSGVLLLHRVMAVFDERGALFVVHQGDASASSFATAARRDVLARMTGFHAEPHALPTPERLGGDARARYARRRLACVGFLAARRLARALHVSERPVVRRCAHVYRKLARAVSG